MIKLRLASIITAIFALALVIGVTPAHASASVKPDASCNSRILTFPAWYNGLAGKSGSECTIITIGNGDKEMTSFITRVALNIVEIILQLVGYAATVFLIIGGYHYLLSSGDANKLTAAKNTILHAVIGLVISLFSVAIVNVIAGAL